MTSYADRVRIAAAGSGTVDLRAIERDRAAEIADELAVRFGDPGRREAHIAEHAAKSAKHERAQWESAETATLRKQFGAAAWHVPLFDLDPDLMVPLGGGVAVRLGTMTRADRVQRRAMRSDVHRDEVAAFEAEMAFWDAVDAAVGTGRLDDRGDEWGVE